MSKFSKFNILILVFFVILIFFPSCSGDNKTKKSQKMEHKDSDLPKLGTIISVNKLKFKVIARGRKTFDYVATDKKLWIYCYGDMSSNGTKPKTGKFANQIEAKKGDVVKIDPSVPEIFINGKISDLVMKFYFMKFKNQIMLLMEMEK
jgi:hypothetical protein